MEEFFVQSRSKDSNIKLEIINKKKGKKIYLAVTILRRHLTSTLQPLDKPLL